MNNNYFKTYIYLLYAPLIGLLVFTFGCSSSESNQRSIVSAPRENQASPSSANKAFGFTSGDTNFEPAAGEDQIRTYNYEKKRATKKVLNDTVAGVAGRKESTTESAPTEIPPQKNNRKVIYNSSLSIDVDTFDGVDTEVNNLVNKYNGFVASANLDHLQGKRRNGKWQVRVPVENYHSFMSTMGGIGTVVKRTEKASDVTAEFYDLDARIKNKLRLEERIVELLEEAKGNLSRLFEVERELSRVREEIERMQGRKRLMVDVTSLTTIDIRIQEIETYEPAAKTAFDDRVDTAWTLAVSQATETGQNLTVNLIRNTFNIAFAVVGLIVAWLVYRIFFRKRAVAVTTTTTS